MKAYYNENSPFHAAWLRELIRMGEIAPGDVDERSIEDVRPTDLVGYTQCHFFAGIGVWSYALRLSGWPDDRPVWTGSCPCPPFSVAGKKKPCPECGSKKPLPHAFRTGIFRCTACGHDWYADGRHLWPELYRLTRECRPVVAFGEQVAGRDGLAWGDIVQATLELENYTVGRVPFGACSVGAPNIRQRLYWVASSDDRGLLGAPGSAFGLSDACMLQPKQFKRAGTRPDEAESWRAFGQSTGCGDALRLADHFRTGLETVATQGPPERGAIGWASSPCGLADHDNGGLLGRNAEGEEHAAEYGEFAECGSPLELDNRERPGPTNGHWRDVDWLLCRDGWWRPVESINEPLADGLADRLGYRRIGGRYSLDPLKEKAENRVGRLMGYGNAINAIQAAEFIRAYMGGYNQ